MDQVQITVASPPEYDRLVVEVEIRGNQIVSLFRVTMEGDEPLVEFGAGDTRSSRVVVSLAELKSALSRAEAELRGMYPTAAT